MTTKQDLEVTVAVNQDEKKLLLMKTLENPHIWYHTEFPHEEEAAGMTKEMKSMRDFGVFDEVDIDKVRVKLWNQLSPRSGLNLESLMAPYVVGSWPEATRSRWRTRTRLSPLPPPSPHSRCS